MFNNNPNFYANIAAQKKAEEEARMEAEKKRIEESAGIARKEIKADFDAGKQLGQEILGDGLGRIKDDEDVKKSRDLMATRAEEGLTTREENAMREKALTQMGGSEQGQRRALSASLARSGVRGGAAGQMQVELAAQALQNRRAFETDLVMNDEATKRKAEMDFANFTTKLADFDLGQAAKEKNIMLQTQLATAQLGSTERGATKNLIAQENAAKAKKGGCFPPGTMITMADGSEKHIESLKIGDETAEGGMVTGTHAFLNKYEIYLINGVLMTDSHGIFDGEEWVRARDHFLATKTNMVPTKVYCVSTEKHRLKIGNMLLLDYEETDLDLSEEDALKFLNKKKAS